ncbi:hypothetical protein [Atribacter laminatus]|uniref:Uncharacterized protein n=1 Tax=Atribacter laminatus TaxID=2847778 RepID=A0A7T1AKW2_ATRLM|nr:hypothetical protein [Atribacter laminatus]QPM67798.1 hypothetical protein RT761_01010 [Atribacter laminatus]
MKYGVSWAFILLLIFSLVMPVWADIQKAEITTVKYEGVGENASITIEGLINSDQTGIGYLEAFITFEGKDYKTQAVEIESRIPEQNYRYSFRLDDFRYIDHQKNQVEILSIFQPGQTIIVYLYEEKITDGENLTVDAQNELNQRGYALRGILAKKTFKLP